MIQNVFLPNSSFHFPKIDGRQFKRVWLKQFSWLCYSPSTDGGFCLACVLFSHEFAKSSKVKLLRTNPVRLSPSAVSDFKRHVEGKRKEKDSDRNRTLHKDTWWDADDHTAQFLEQGGKFVLFLSLFSSLHINFQYILNPHESLFIKTVNLFSSIALLIFSHLQVHCFFL